MRHQDSFSEFVQSLSFRSTLLGAGSLASRKTLAATVALGTVSLAAGPASVQVLINGGVVSGAISFPGDEDCYTFDASAGEGFQVQVADAGATPFDPMVRLYNPSGGLLETRSGEDVASIVRTAGPTGMYTIVVSDGNNPADQTGTYHVYFTRAPGANEGGALPNGGSVLETVDLGDLDSYTFDASAGEGFQLQLADTGGGPFDPMMRLYDPTGSLLETRWGPDVASIVRTAGVAGTYTVVLSDGNTPASQAGNYELFFARMPGANEGGALPNGGSVLETVDLGDLDSYTFDASAGEGFQLQLADTGGGPFDPMMRLYDPAGSLLETRWGADVASIVRTAGVGGTYTVVVSDGNTPASQAGNYELFLARMPGANEGGALPNGGSVLEAVDLGDLDSYVFDASVGEGFQLQLADTGGGLFDPMMRLYGPAGSLLETRWGSDVASIVRTAGASGTHTVVVSDGNTPASQTGTYELYFTRRPGADEGGTLNNGGAVSGTIDLGDLDSYTFAASAGEGFQLQMADVDGTALDPMMRLYDPFGDLLETRWGSDVASIARTAAMTGVFTVVVSDGNTPASQTGDYEVHFTRAPGANEGGELPNGGVVSGTIDLGDLDSYTFAASAGEGFQLQMADVDGTALDPMMRLYDPFGDLLETRWGSDVASIVRTAAMTGVFTVVVSDGNTPASQTGDYEIHFVRLPGANEGGRLTRGRVVLGSISLGDLDSYTFHATADDEIQARVVKRGATSLRPRMRLYGPEGALLQTQSGPAMAAIMTTATMTGIYTLVVEDGNTPPSGVGPYYVQLLPSIGPNWTPAPSSGDKVPAGQVAGG